MSKKIRNTGIALAALLILGTLIYSNFTHKKPQVVLVQPETGERNVGEITTIAATVINVKNGLNLKSLNAGNIFLTEAKTGFRVPASIKTDRNTISLKPVDPLKTGTAYVLHITNNVKDISGNNILPFTSYFTTAPVSTREMQQVQFEKVLLSNTDGRYTSLVMGPDGFLYALCMDGLIKRFPVRPDGTLGTADSLYTLQDAYGKRQQRLAIGLAFDPASTPTNLIAYVSHSSMMLSDAPDWDGKLTRLYGAYLQKAQDILINLPRSTEDHLTNSIAFGPDSALYFTQGSNTAMGAGDKTWKFREEHLLSAAVLRLDMKKLGRLPLDVKTTDAGGHYDPYATDAPLTLYATGLRNSYDLVWHSNGELYIPTNGSSPGGNTPASVKGTKRPDCKPYNGPQVAALKNVKQSQHDLLFRVEKGGYYGHPNPKRGEYVMNGGNPTAANDLAQVDEYPVGTKPDANWKGIAFDFRDHKSPNGLIEYKSNAFNGALKGKLLVVRFSSVNDIIVLTPGGQEKNIVSFHSGNSIEGLSGFVTPLDLIEDERNGNLYVAEFGSERITLLKPRNIATKPVSIQLSAMKN